MSSLQTPPNRLTINSLASLPPAERTKKLASLRQQLTPAEWAALGTDWKVWARDNQLPPPGDWTYWLILAGRGFGKTRTGAETMRMWSKVYKRTTIAAPVWSDVVDVMIEGESGILNVCPDGERPIYKNRKLHWPNGAVTLCLSADEPERFRGKQHEALWVDELASFRYDDAWDQAMFGLRLGPRPRALITTTPKPRKLVRELMANPNCVVTRGSTYDNRANLAPEFYTAVVNKYEGTRLGRQELMAEVLDDVQGALFRRANIDEHRRPLGAVPEFVRVVVAIDPAVSSEDHSNETGIIVVGEGVDGRLYVLDDASGVYAPDDWARGAIAAFRQWDATTIVIETNQGGGLLKTLLRSYWPECPIQEVRASQGKYTRAEPISAMYEQGRVSHVGKFPLLEDQMCIFTSDFDRRLQGLSPDRLDALVWGCTYLIPKAINVQKRGAVRRRVVHQNWRSR